MHQFCKNLITEWRRLELPFEDKTLVVAVSGGADSIALALALEELRDRGKLKLRLVIAHFNHQLRGKESDADEKFVRQIAGKYRFELALGHEKDSGKKGNIEQNARIARYEFLAETAANLHAFAVVAAHTLNDQAETFLINLLRGSGLEGLGGMRTTRLLDREIAGKKSQIPNPKSQIKLVRPLLAWADRAMTEKYCLEREVEYRYDTMNEDLAFQRVRIRKVLLPLLADFNPKIVETLARTSFLLQEDYEALEKISRSGVAGFEDLLGKHPSELPLRELQNLFPSMRRKTLRDWLRSERGDLRRLDSKHFEAIEKLIFSRKSGREVELPNRETVRKKDGKIVFMRYKG